MRRCGLSDRSYGARPLRRALQKYIEDPLSEALIQGTITTRPAFIEIFLEDNKLYYRSVDSQETESVLPTRELEFVSLIGRGGPSGSVFCFSRLAVAKSHAQSPSVSAPGY